VFITGASSGLGRGLALHYAKEGATVHAAARRAAEIEVLAREAPPGHIVPVVLDVTDPDRLVKAIRDAEAAPTNARKMDWTKVRRILDVNVTAACVTIAAALPGMVARNAGHVVAMASLAAFRGMPGNAAYCASKAAVHIFMESVRVDLRGTGVVATTIYPGFVKTELTAKNKFRMPFLMEVDDAVEVMTRGIARKKATVAYPLPMAAAVRALSVLPRSLYEPLAGRSRMSS
jgi:NADP-dependent 3-hydroxy acid dehydrogenase YdfG